MTQQGIDETALAQAGSVVLMSEDEARSCVLAINRSLDQARGLLLDLYEREGWRALKYQNWRACVQIEFGFKQSRVYQLLTAAKIEREISTEVENVPSTPEKHLRPLAALDTPEERREVWVEAVATAPDGQMTERHVRATVTRRQQSDRGDTPTAYRAERRTEPACVACAQFTNPDNWFVTDKGDWMWVGSEAPPHLRAIQGEIA